MDETLIKQEVRDRYAHEALKVRNVKGSACCGSSASACGAAITSSLYAEAETAQVPDEALAASLGCGNRRRWLN